MRGVGAHPSVPHRSQGQGAQPGRCCVHPRYDRPAPIPSRPARGILPKRTDPAAPASGSSRPGFPARVSAPAGGEELGVVLAFGGGVCCQIPRQEESDQSIVRIPHHRTDVRSRDSRRGERTTMETYGIRPVPRAMPRRTCSASPRPVPTRRPSPRSSARSWRHEDWPAPCGTPAGTEPNLSCNHPARNRDLPHLRGRAHPGANRRPRARAACGIPGSVGADSHMNAIGGSRVRPEVGGHPDSDPPKNPSAG